MSKRSKKCKRSRIAKLVENIMHYEFQPQEFHSICEFLRICLGKKVSYIHELLMHITLYGNIREWWDDAQRLRDPEFADIISDFECGICKYKFGVLATEVLPCCRQIFHGDCLNKWLMNLGFCPCCNHKFWNP